jgi:hypothetical protein
MPEPILVELHPYERRFGFLFPVGSHKQAWPYTPRYTLHAPDILDLRWSVFDQQARETLGRGETPELATDAAMITVGIRAELENLDTTDVNANVASVGGAE